eukprot:gene29262-37750_t
MGWPGTISMGPDPLIAVDSLAITIVLGAWKGGEGGESDGGDSDGYEDDEVEEEVAEAADEVEDEEVADEAEAVGRSLGDSAAPVDDDDDGEAFASTAMASSRGGDVYDEVYDDDGDE